MNIRNVLASILAGALGLGMLVLGDPYAESVVTWVPGPVAGSDPLLALGPPTGGGTFGGSSLVHTLGTGGSLTVELATRCLDGPGTDLIVQENAFLIATDTSRSFAEAVFVEVSSDGVTYAGFPARYVGPPVQSGPFDGVNPEWYVGFAGVLPVAADPTLGVDPLDVVRGGGDAFDLVDLAGHAEVLSGQVDLDDIRYVRVTDVDSGTDLDSQGALIFDAGLDGFASADIDAFTAVNHVMSGDPSRPRVEITLDNGFLSIQLTDLDGLSDIKGDLLASANGLSFEFFELLPFFALTEVSSVSATFVTGPVPPGLVQVILKVAARDHAGNVGGDAIHLF